jgi:hypothetical protein
MQFGKNQIRAGTASVNDRTARFRPVRRAPGLSWPTLPSHGSLPDIAKRPDRGGKMTGAARRRVLAGTGMMAMLALAGPGRAGPAPATASPAASAPVSAETLALRKLRDTLAMDGDQRAIVDARVQIDALLARQPEPPPGADILRAAADRVEAAVAALRDAARQTPPAAPAAPPWPAVLPAWLMMPLWGVPRLAFAAGCVALTCLFAMAALVVAGRRLVTGHDAAQAAMQAGGKLFDAAARRFARAQDDASHAADAASGAASQAGQAALRLAGAVRDTEPRLRACLQEAEARLQNAGAMARQCDQSAARLPGMMEDAVQTIVAIGLPAFEDAAAALRDSASAVTAQFETEAQALPALLADAILAVAARGLPAMEAATAGLAAQAEAVALAATSLAEANTSQETLLARLEAVAALPPPEPDPATVAPAEWRAALDHGNSAMQAARLDLAELSARLTETAGKMEAALTEAGSAREVIEAASSWPDSASALSQAATAMQFQARGLAESAMAHNIAVVERLSEAGDTLAGLPNEAQALGAVREQMQDQAAALTRAISAASAYCLDQSEASRAARTALDALPEAARALQEICAQLGRAGAGLHGTGALLHHENAQIRHEIGALHDGLLGGLEAVVHMVREEAAAMRAAHAERDRATSTPLSLAELRGAIDHIQSAAARVLAGAEAQDAAASRVAEAAQAVSACLAAQPEATNFARLNGLVAETDILHAQAEVLTRFVSRGGGIPASLARETPALLAAIEIAIQRLRGTAEALALAGDAAQEAA